jgi:hypothetical protein
MKVTGTNGDAASRASASGCSRRRRGRTRPPAPGPQRGRAARERAGNRSGTASRAGAPSPPRAGPRPCRARPSRPVAAALQPRQVVVPEAVAGRRQGEQVNLVPARVQELEQVGDRELVAAGHRQRRTRVEEQDPRRPRGRSRPHRPGHLVVALVGPRDRGGDGGGRGGGGGGGGRRGRNAGVAVRNRTPAASGKRWRAGPPPSRLGCPPAQACRPARHRGVSRPGHPRRPKKRRSLESAVKRTEHGQRTARWQYNSGRKIKRRHTPKRRHSRQL